MSLPLFWHRKYSELQMGRNNLLTFHGSDYMKNLIIPYRIEKSIFQSPGIGTFGGLFPSGDVGNWDDAWNRLMDLTHGIMDFRVTFPPSYFRADIFMPQIESCIKLFNPKITTDLNQHIKLDYDSSILLSKGNKKKVRQFRELGGNFKRGNTSDLNEIIDLLIESRRRLGVNLSMSKDELFNCFQKLPSTYSCYKVEIEESLAAAAITVEISEDVLYVLYWGDDAKTWRYLSPVASLFVGLYEEAHQLGYTFLDLGISSVHGEINTGLRNFKSNLGCSDSAKVSVDFRKPKKWTD